jgi:ubiquinone/menaquinone biosynthesis C-methylase UbiE
MSDVQDFSEKTREIYHKQHMRIANDAAAMKRFIGMFSTEYFQVEDTFFSGKKVLDAGCGDTGKVIIALAQMGASELHGLDLGVDFIPVATKSIQARGIDTNKVFLRSGSVLELPYEDEEFDFVVCHGVLLHLNSLDEVTKAFKELARVTKQGGKLYTVYGVVGGLLEDAVIPAVRQYYAKDEAFRGFIDNVSPENFHQMSELITRVSGTYTDEALDVSKWIGLLDTDFCVMLQNLIQAPVRLPVSEQMVLSMYRENGFEPPNKLKRYVKRQNIRKYLAPFHFESENSISRLFWGSGNLEFIAEKK